MVTEQENWFCWEITLIIITKVWFPIAIDFFSDLLYKWIVLLSRIMIISVTIDLTLWKWKFYWFSLLSSHSASAFPRLDGPNAIEMDAWSTIHSATAFGVTITDADQWANLKDQLGRTKDGQTRRSRTKGEGTKRSKTRIAEDMDAWTTHTLVIKTTTEVRRLFSIKAKNVISDHWRLRHNWK